MKEEIMSKRGVCANFTNPVPGKEPCPSNGEERTLLAHGMRFACNGYGKKKEKAPATAKADPGHGKTVVTEQSRPERDDKEVIIVLRTTEDSQLYERVLEMARRNRRGAGDEMLHLVQTAIEQGMDGNRVEVGKIRKIVERMKGYPVPNGSTKEVFQATLQMVMERLAEMEAA